jgi:2-polyprenyl-6-hydroxyphenyl methylase/3-demethylubiquinone-9 3-methyltransferase
MMATHAEEVRAGQRFEFGKNWSRFLSRLNDERIQQGEDSLRNMLRADSLVGKSFLDIGNGSGLFSLAARRLGARVHSFDYDPHSVACARELKRRYFEDDPDWTIEEGSALDEEYLTSLGKFDVVYSWGVLHHTGNMWKALENAAIPVADGGQLFISIYNDQGTKSKLWTKVKKLYCSGPIGRVAMTVVGGGWIVLNSAKEDLVRFKNPMTRYREYRKRRGMSAWHDVVDWLGGYPFEVATPQQIFDFYFDRGFQLTRLTTDGGGSGTNQFVFDKTR